MMKKNIVAGDTLVLYRSDGKKFGKARVTFVKETTFGELTDGDKEGHEKFKSKWEMYKTYANYYKIKVDSKTKLKIIKFDLIKWYIRKESIPNYLAILLVAFILGYNLYLFQHVLSIPDLVMLFEWLIFPIIIVVSSKIGLIKKGHAEILMVIYLALLLLYIKSNTLYNIADIEALLLNTPYIIWQLYRFLLILTIISLAFKFSKRMNYFLIALSLAFTFFIILGGILCIIQHKHEYS